MSEPKKATFEKSRRILEAAEKELIELVGELEQGRFPIDRT
ncbi:MAG: hypothetical protein ACOC38_04280 [Promethearchaeia archaeon]